MFLIKPLAADEANILVRISQQTFEETFAALNTRENMDLFMSTAFSTGKLLEETSEQNLWFFLIWDGNEPIGYLKLKRHEMGYPGVDDTQPILEICRIYVVKAAIGRGIGQKMMDFCFEFCSEQGFKKILLGVWEHNERAIAFYRKNGFEKVGSHSFLLGKDPQNDWLMSKNS